jgi:hypothetical protein
VLVELDGQVKDEIYTVRYCYPEIRIENHRTKNFTINSPFAKTSYTNDIDYEFCSNRHHHVTKLMQKIGSFVISHPNETIQTLLREQFHKLLIRRTIWVGYSAH